MSMRELVVVSDVAAYLDRVPAADFSWRRAEAPRLMDAFVARYRAAGWPVHDHRPARLPVTARPEVERSTRTAA
jgi:hypothetical protein